jgi:uncharacterized membrane protein
MPFVILFVLLSLGGIANASYLVYKHKKKNEQPFVCPLKSDCTAVTESKWSSIFGVRNETLGLLYYIGALLLIIASIILPAYRNTIYLLELMMTGGGFIFSVFLTYLQLVVIKNYCFWCLVSAGIGVLMFGNALVIFFF